MRFPVVVLALSALAIGCATEAQRANEADTVALAALLTTPERYTEKSVSVVGWVNLEFEANLLCLRGQDAELLLLPNCIWLAFPPEHLEASRAAHGGYSVVSGVFTTSRRGHLGGFVGSVVIAEPLYPFPKRR